MSLVELGPDELGHRPLGPRRAGPAQRPGPHVGEPGHLGLAPTARISRSRCAAVLSRLSFQMRRASWMGPELRADDPAADGHPLVHQGGRGHPPPGADGVEALAVGDADVGEEDLVELGVTGDLAQGADLDARGVHVDDEVGQCPGASARRGRCGPGAVPSVAVWASVVHTFWPFTTHSSPSRTARVASPATSDPAPGSLKSWHQISSHVKRGRR